MKKALSILTIVAFVFGMSGGAQAGGLCDLDAAGITQFEPTIEVHPDGVVNLFNVAPSGTHIWWEDDIFACYKSYENKGYLKYFPRCDLDGNGVVDILPLIDAYYFVLNFPTGGLPLYEVTCVNGCYDLGPVNFMAGTGSPMALGAAVIDGECQTVFGNQVPAYIELYANMAACEMTCGAMTMIEDFESDSATWPWAPWQSPQAVGFSLVNPINAHDGAQGLQLGEWHYRTDTSFGTVENDVLSMWCYAGATQGCRLGFGADATGRFDFRLSVSADYISLNDSHGEQDPWGFNPPTMAVTYSATDILPDAWYKMEVHTRAGGEIDAQLWAEDGTPVASVQYNFGAFPATGIAIYGGTEHYVDTIEMGPSNGICIDMDLDGSCDADDLCIGYDPMGDDDGDGICNDTDLCIGVDMLGDADSDGNCDTHTCDPATPAFYDQTGSQVEWAAGGTCVEVAGVGGAPACTPAEWQRHVNDINYFMANYDFTNATWDGATTGGQTFAKAPDTLLCGTPGADHTIQPLFDDLNACYHANNQWMSGFGLAIINFDWGVNVWSLFDLYNDRAALMGGACEFDTLVGKPVGFHGTDNGAPWIHWTAQGTADCDYAGCRCDAQVTGWSDGAGGWFEEAVTNNSGPLGFAGQVTDCTDPRFAF